MNLVAKTLIGALGLAGATVALLERERRTQIRRYQMSRQERFSEWAAQLDPEFVEWMRRHR